MPAGRPELYRKLGSAVQRSKVGKVMGEFKRGTLHSGSGQRVTDRKQAIAIALSEARKKKQ